MGHYRWNIWNSSIFFIYYKTTFCNSSLCDLNITSTLEYGARYKWISSPEPQSSKPPPILCIWGTKFVLTLGNPVSPFHPSWVRRRFTVHGHFLPEALVNVYCTEEGHWLGQILQTQLVGKHAPENDQSAHSHALLWIQAPAPGGVARAPTEQGFSCFSHPHLAEPWEWRQA